MNREGKFDRLICWSASLQKLSVRHIPVSRRGPWAEMAIPQVASEAQLRMHQTLLHNQIAEFHAKIANLDRQSRSMKRIARPRGPVRRLRGDRRKCRAKS